MKCPECGCISFDHSEICKNCSYQFSNHPHENFSFTNEHNHTSKESFHIYFLSNSSYNKEKLLEKNIKEDFMGLSVNPMESNEKQDDSPVLSVFFQESEDDEEDFFEDSFLSPEGTEGIQTKRINGGNNKSRGGFWIRSLAFTIDLFFLNILITIFTWTIKLGILTGSSIIAMSPETLIDLREFLIIIVGVAIFAFYFIYFHGKIGQTPGKRLFHLKVIRTDGNPLGLNKAIERFLCYFISLIPLYVGFLLIAFNKEKQGLHDIIARTYVIKT